VGTEPVAPLPPDAERISDFCRDIEAYLCRKNDGHLIRIVGPSFDIVSGWAARGVPLKVACEGIDRYFERYYRKGPRRRPVKIDFCEADVLDVFEEWRRATGMTSRPAGSGDPGGEAARPHRASLPEHLERVVTRLSSARATGTLAADVDPLIDRLAAELDTARAKPGGVRGEARAALVARLSAIDAELLQSARDALGRDAMGALSREAEAELAPFRSAMPADAYQRARRAAIDRAIRSRLRLPVIAWD
jgi:hypothetical protein